MTQTEPTVFVVDDDNSVCKSLKRLMQSVGIAVEAFASAEQFLQRSHPDGPACLVLDVRMPGLSGLALQEELSGDATMPIVFITGHGNVSMSVRAIKRGAVDFLEKPFDDQQLLDAVQQAFEQSARARRKRDETGELHERLDSLTPRERQVFRLVVTGNAEQTDWRHTRCDRKNR